jgi:hypothetical protein
MTGFLIGLVLLALFAGVTCRVAVKHHRGE